MTTLLRPTYSLRLGSQRFTNQAMEIALLLDTAPVVDALTARFPAGLALSAAAGDAVELLLDDTKVFTGTIEAVHHGLEETRVRALNGGGALTRFRPAATYEKVTAGEVARSLCGDAEVGTGDVAAGVSLAFYAADPSRNAFEHIARVAGWSGAVARITEEDELEMRVVRASAADLALRYGRDLLGLEIESRPATLEGFVFAGESGAGSTAVPEALRPTTDFFGGNRPEGPSATSRWSSAPALRTAKAAASARAAEGRAYSASRLRGHLTALLQPELRPGMTIKVSDLPEGMPRDVLWLRRVRHILGAQGATTRADFYRGGSAVDPAALLGSALSAFGG